MIESNEMPLHILCDAFISWDIEVEVAWLALVHGEAPECRVHVSSHEHCFRSTKRNTMLDPVTMESSAIAVHISTTNHSRCTNSGYNQYQLL